ncbi:MAG: ribonuclease III [Chloroflexi bacterium]|nr:ribonuclease III [Chloroflexota bacterium]
MSDLQSIEDGLGVDFKNKELLKLAFVHSSYINENPGVLPESNERLEYLGDAILGLAVAHELYRRYPTKQEGDLTNLRSALVRGDTLAEVAQSLHLGEYLVMGVGEDAGGGRERRSNLAAVFEALVGAVLEDRGYEAAEAFVLKVLARQLDSVEELGRGKNAKSALQELLQGRGMSPPTYQVVDMTGKDHTRTFTSEVLINGKVMGKGAGRRKALSEQEAAADALRAFEDEG